MISYRQEDMKTLKQFVEETFKIPLSMIMTEDKVMPLDGTVETAYLFGSEAARNNLYFSQSDMDDFIISCPQPYFFTGHTGYGNSVALYYVRADEWSRIFFRLPYGGVYMDNPLMAQYVHNFLINYFLWEKAIKGKTKTLIAAESMYEGHYKIELHSGECFEMHESLFRNPSFDECFGHLYSKETE
jgi:hypothetical protein